MLIPEYSSLTVKSRIEQATYIHFVDFLDDIAGSIYIILMFNIIHIIFNNYLDGSAYEDTPDGRIVVTFEDLLIFFTAADREPPLGFPNNGKGKLAFLHGSDQQLATASTCDLILRLPTCHVQYCSFKEKMVMSLTSHEGFGLL